MSDRTVWKYGEMMVVAKNKATADGRRAVDLEILRHDSKGQGYRGVRFQAIKEIQELLRFLNETFAELRDEMQVNTSPKAL